MSFAPSDLDGIIAHWRSEDIPSDGADPLNWDDYITGWRLSASGTARPTYSATSIGGLPGLVFDGTNDRLCTTTAKTLAGATHVAVVLRRDAADYDSVFALYQTNDTNPAFSNTLCSLGLYVPPLYNQSTYIYGRVVAAGAYFTGSETPANGSESVVVCGRGDLHGDIFTVSGRMTGDGAGLTAMNGLGDAPSQSQYLHVGSPIGQWLNGAVSEIVMWYQGSLSIDRHWIEGYLCHKYGITLPTWHPYYAAAPTSPPSAGGTARPTHPMYQQVIG